MERTGAPVDEFLDSIECSQGDDLREPDRIISTELPGSERVLWEGTFRDGTAQQVIGHGTILQPRPRGGDIEWMPIGLAAQKQHLSVHVSAVEEGQYLVRRHAAALGKVKVGASTVTFEKLEDLDFVAFRTLLRRARTVECYAHRRLCSWTERR